MNRLRSQLEYGAENPGQLLAKRLPVIEGIELAAHAATAFQVGRDTTELHPDPPQHFGRQGKTRPGPGWAIVMARVCRGLLD